MVEYFPAAARIT